MFFVFFMLKYHQNEPAVPTQLPSHPTAARPAAPSLNPTQLAPIVPTAPRDTLEYRTALELELWKEEQEDLFDDQVNTGQEVTAKIQMNSILIMQLKLLFSLNINILQHETTCLFVLEKHKLLSVAFRLFVHFI